MIRVEKSSREGRVVYREVLRRAAAAAEELYVVVRFRYREISARPVDVSVEIFVLAVVMPAGAMLAAMRVFGVGMTAMLMRVFEVA